MAHKQRSKSTSSIPAELDVQRKVCCEELQKICDQAKETEERWKDVLDRWKNHRRSVHANMVTDREELELASGGCTRKPDTPSERQGGESREAGTPAGHKAASFHNPQCIGFKLQPRSKSLPPRIYAKDRSYTPAERAVTPPATRYSAPERTTRETSLNTSSNRSSAYPDRTRTTQTGTAPNIPINSTAADRTANRLTGRTGATVANVTGGSNTGRTGASLSDLPGGFPAYPRSASAAEGRGAGSTYKAPDLGRSIGGSAREKSPGPLQDLHSMDTKLAAAQVTASLPRSGQRSDSLRLASVVSPRPFGTQSTKISPVSRAFTMDDSYRRFNGQADLSQDSVSPNHQHLFLTPEAEARSQPGSIPKSNETSYEDIRISLNQRTSSSQDFGFQTSWHSTGIFINTIQQGCPAELCQLRAGDEIVAVDGCRVSEMSREQWNASLDSALQQGSLALDIRRNRENGAPEKYMNANNKLISWPPMEIAVNPPHTFNSQVITDAESKGINDRYHPESMESKESEPLSLKNFKRRSEFFEPQGGSESAISDLQIPSIATSSTHHSWDPKEERRRQEKWQQEQERLLQEKYKRDQQKLEEEWRQAQQDAVKEGSGNHVEKYFEVDTRSHSPLPLTSPLSQATHPPSEEPYCLEDGSELEEAPLQGAKTYQDDVERNLEGVELGLWRNCEESEQQPRPEEAEESKMCQQATDASPREQEGTQGQEQRKGDGFAKIHPEISLTDRAKSKSTPELDEVDKPEDRACSSSVRKSTAPPSQGAQKMKKKKSRPLSQVEQDRLQILEEMKKKTQLLTDTSWIRQRSTNIYKEPIRLGGVIRRYESLDNLNTARSWKQSQWPPTPSTPASSSDRPQSAASASASSRGYAHSSSSTLPTSFSMGSLRHSPWSQPSPTSPTPPATFNEESSAEPEPGPPSQRRSSASTASLTSGDQSLDLEPELKSDCVTSSSTADSATHDSQMDWTSPCDLTTLLQAEEETTDNRYH